MLHKVKKYLYKHRKIMKTNAKYSIYTILSIAIIVTISIFVGRYIHSLNGNVIEGTIECKTYRASSKLPGRIDSLFVSEGDWVDKGELLYTISTPELDAKLRQVAALEAAAEALNLEVERGVRWEEVDAAKSLWNKAEAGLELAKKSLARVENLYNKGVVPRQQYDEAMANYAAMDATSKAAKAAYDMAKDGATKEQRAAVAAKVREAQAAVDEVRAYLSDARVYAPIAGRVSNIIAEHGELISSGYPVVTILDLSDIWAVFNIKEDDMLGISIGTHFEGYVPALGASCDFEVYYISAEADFATWSATRARGGFDIRTFEIRARPRNEYLLPGMSVVVNDVI